MTERQDTARSGDVVVTVTASGVRDAHGNAIPQVPGTTIGDVRKQVGLLRTERTELAHRYQELRGDLGGLLIEMARRDRFNQHLLRLRADEAVAVERRALEIDATLALAAAGNRQALPPGTVAMTGTQCATCHGAMPADANFCAYCGTPTR